MIYDLKDPKELELLGIGILSINEAAALITKCLHYDGEIDLGDEEEDVDYETSVFSLELEERLKPHTEKFVKLLIKAIENKTLIARSIKKDLEEKFLPEETYINNEDLIKWLEERNISFGDLYYDEYMDFESDLINEIDRYIENKKTIKKYPKEYKKFKESILTNPDSMFSYRVNNKKESGLNNRNSITEKPLHKKEKDSLLKLFIGMVVSNYGLDNVLNEDVKASEISKDIMVNSGIDMDDDTVRKYLKKSLEILKQHQ